MKVDIGEEWVTIRHGSGRIVRAKILECERLEDGEPRRILLDRVVHDRGWTSQRWNAHGAVVTELVRSRF